MDSFHLRTNNHPTSTSKPIPTTSNTQEEQEEISDPLQEWLVFSPPIDEEQDQISSSISSFQSINYQSIYHHTSMPSHDGRGHFFTPPQSLSSPTTSELDYHHQPIIPLPITTQSLSSLSEFNSQDPEQDLLSIPSSISLTHSVSSRSSNPPHPHTHQAEMSPEDTELLLTPMAISAGLSHHSHRSSTHHQPVDSSRSSHQSIDPRTSRRIHRPTSHSRRTHSRSSPHSRINPISSATRNTHPILTMPSDKKINQLSPTRIANISFFTSVASKILDLDSDTMNMLSSPTPQETQTIKNKHTHHTSRSPESKNNKRRAPPRFSIADEDPRTSTTHESDMISSPLDLSGFMPPSVTSVWRTNAKRGEQEDEDEEEEEQEEEAAESSRATLKIPHSRSHVHLASSSPSSLLRRSSSSSEIHKLPLSLALPSPASEISSTNSMATILLTKVLNEWTNW